MYFQLLGRDLAYFSLDPGCWSLVGFCSWSYVPGNVLFRTFCIRNRLRSEDVIPCHQFLHIYSSHFAFFSEAAKECKSKHVNCFKIRMTSEVMPEKGSPRQQECPMWNIELWNLRPRFHQTIDSKTENEHVNTVQYKKCHTATVFATVYDHKVQRLVAAFLQNQW